MIVLYLALGGAIGTLARYGTGSLLAEWTGDGFPWATVSVNVVGSFLLGLLLALAERSVISPELRLVLGAGFCGAFTTFSTFSLEAVALIQAGYAGRAAIYVIGSVLSGLMAAALGLRLGS